MYVKGTSYLIALPVFIYFSFCLFKFPLFFADCFAFCLPV